MVGGEGGLVKQKWRRGPQIGNKKNDIGDMARLGWDLLAMARRGNGRRLADTCFLLFSLKSVFAAKRMVLGGIWRYIVALGAVFHKIRVFNKMDGETGVCRLFREFRGGAIRIWHIFAPIFAICFT